MTREAGSEDLEDQQLEEAHQKVGEWLTTLYPNSRAAKITRFFRGLDETDPANFPTDNETLTQPPFPVKSRPDEQA